MATKCPKCGSTDVTIGGNSDVSCLVCKNGQADKKGRP